MIRTAIRALALLLVLGLAACDQITLPAGFSPADFPPAAQVPAPPQNGAPGELVVPLQVTEGRNGSVIPIIQVFISGQGPFTFALDTGASQTLIDEDVVEQLGLEETGRTGQVAGVTGITEAALVRVDEWAAGEVALPAINAITLDLPEHRGDLGLQGLLGSDVLSTFGAITVDYENEVLILRPHSQASAAITGTPR